MTILLFYSPPFHVRWHLHYKSKRPRASQTAQIEALIFFSVFPRLSETSRKSSVLQQSPKSTSPAASPSTKPEKRIWLRPQIPLRRRPFTRSMAPLLLPFRTCRCKPGWSPGPTSVTRCLAAVVCPSAPRIIPRATSSTSGFPTFPSPRSSERSFWGRSFSSSGPRRLPSSTKSTAASKDSSETLSARAWPS